MAAMAGLVRGMWVRARMMLGLKRIRTPHRLIESGVSALYLLTVLFVLAFAVVLARHLVQGLFRVGDPRALLTLMDPLLMLMMLAELLHTIALTLRTRHLPLRPLLALVFIAVLRHAVVLASTASIASIDAGATLTGLIVLSLLLVNLPAHDLD